MRFKCRYQSIKPVDGKLIERHTTIDADSLHEADKKARQHSGKSWRVLSVKQQLYAVD
jgi:hypothetical protein